MTQRLYMVGLTVQNMERSQEFYRRLGLDIPAWEPQTMPLMIKMGEDFTFFLSPQSIPGEQAADGTKPQDYRVVFEYYLETQAAVKAKYAELIGYGYQSYRAPFVFPNGMYFALVNDPDGNTILLSGEVEKAGGETAGEQ